jgi:HNH endonuclease
MSTAQPSRVRRACQFCGKEMFVQPCILRRGGGKFCSIPCRDRAHFVPLAERFRRHVGPTNSEGCILWVGPIDHQGYGMLGFGGRHVRAHRIAWELVHGSAGNLCILHRCDRPYCVNVAHLFLGTRADNIADCVAKDRQARGEKKSRLTEAVVRSIRQRYAAGVRQSQLAREHNISPVTVCNIVHRRKWKHLE